MSLTPVAWSAWTTRTPRRADWTLVDRVEKQSLTLEKLSDHELREGAITLRSKAAKMSPGELKMQGAAFMREAIRRALGMKYHKVQLLAGTVLGQGAVAEMATGEGKTIVTALPAFLEVLRGHPVHVASPNAYLAQRDFQHLQPVFELLGTTIGSLPEEHDETLKQKAYACDVVYGTGYEFGFDFLRDELAKRSKPRSGLGEEFLTLIQGGKSRQPTQLQRGHGTSVVDEIDSVLIDEAMTPLILSGGVPGEKGDPRPYLAAKEIADSLEEGIDYVINREHRNVQLTTAGENRIHRDMTHRPTLPLRRPWTQYIEQSLTAREFFRPDVDFVVRNGEVQIVDQLTGRIFTERSWRAGLHQAVEIRCGAKISTEKESLARITRQRFTRLYERRCGLTGTAAGAEREFHAMYKLPVILIPRNLESQRQDLPDLFFPDRESKFARIVKDTRQQWYSKRPVLIGTRTIEDSRAISECLKANDIDHQVLNGLQDADEASVIAEAGKAGRVTVATNMAGRGTDIKPDPRALAASGLHVIGVERNFSQRIDRQLAGRAGRQGNPGSCQFYVSATDELIERQSSKWVKRFRQSTAREGVVQAEMQAEIDALQAKLEREAYESRLSLVRQDNWLDEVLQTLVGEAAA